MGYADFRNALMGRGLSEKFDRDIHGIENARGAEYANTLRYALSFAHDMETAGLDREYVFIGGYGVLAHIVKSLDSEAALGWRTSNDLDIVDHRYACKSILEAKYEILESGRTINPALKGKLTFLIQDRDIRMPLHIDVYPLAGQEIKIGRGFVGQEFLHRSETHMFYGTKLTVPNIHDLLRLKLDAEPVLKGGKEELRERDRQDILDLTFTINSIGEDPNKTLETDEKARLRGILREMRRETRK